LVRAGAGEGGNMALELVTEGETGWRLITTSPDRCDAE